MHRNRPGPLQRAGRARQDPGRGDRSAHAAPRARVGQVRHARSRSVRRGRVVSQSPRFPASSCAGAAGCRSCSAWAAERALEHELERLAARRPARAPRRAGARSGSCGCRRCPGNGAAAPRPARPRQAGCFCSVRNAPSSPFASATASTASAPSARISSPSRSGSQAKKPELLEIVAERAPELAAPPPRRRARRAGRPAGRSAPRSGRSPARRRSGRSRRARPPGSRRGARRASRAQPRRSCLRRARPSAAAQPTACSASQALATRFWARVSQASATRSSSSSRSSRASCGMRTQHRRVAVEVRGGEEDPAVVGEHQLLHVEVGDAEHQHVVEPLAGLGIERVGPAAALAAEELAVHLVGGPAVVGELLRRLRQRQRELVEVGHRRHAASVDSAP